jgi:uncharacterized membrane protein
MGRSRCSERSDRKKSIRDEYDDKLVVGHETYLDAAVLPSFHNVHTKRRDLGFLRDVSLTLTKEKLSK